MANLRNIKLLFSVVLAVALVISVSAMPLAAGTNIKMAGSTTVLPLAQIWAEAYMDKNPDVNISVSGGGSGTGISMLLNGSCDIANASRAAKPKEIEAARNKNSKLFATKLAKDGLAIIVNAANDQVKNLTMAQLAAIYSGKITNWKEVGGSNMNIIVVGRDSSSGTYGFFQDTVLGGKAYTKDMLSQPSNAAVLKAVSQSKGAIGYVGVAYAEKGEKEGKVNILSISKKAGEPGMKPTPATVRSGEYPLFRYLYAYTIGAPKGAVGQFLKWCTGPEGQALVHKAGYEPLN